MEEIKSDNVIQEHEASAKNSETAKILRENSHKSSSSSSKSNHNKRENPTYNYKCDPGPVVPFGNQIKLAMDVNCNLDWIMNGISKMPRSNSLYASTNFTSGYRGQISAAKLPNYYNNVPSSNQLANSCEYNSKGIREPISGRSFSAKPQHLHNSYQGNNSKENVNIANRIPVNSGGIVMINGVPHVEIQRPMPVPTSNSHVAYNPPLMPHHHRLLDNIHRRQTEKQTEKEYKEIYEYAKKVEKKKYNNKLEKLKKQLSQANKTLEDCQKKPEQRTVKLQTKDHVTKINRGIDACNIMCEDKEVSAQPTFRQESFDKAISEKLDEIEQKAKLESNRKRKVLRVPNGKFLQVSQPAYKPLHTNCRPQSIPHMYNKATIQRADAKYDPIINHKANEGAVKANKRKLPYEREKRVESLSVNEIDSAMKTLMF